MKKKDKKNIAYGGGAIALLVLLWLISGTGSGDNNSTSKYSVSALEAAESYFDFQTVRMSDGNVTHDFTLKNEGTEPVRIEKVYTSCMCTSAMITDNGGKQYGKFGMPGHGTPSRTNIEIAPGEIVVVEAIYDPNAHGPSGVGLAQRSIYIETNSAKKPKVELKFQAMVTR